MKLNFASGMSLAGLMIVAGLCLSSCSRRIYDPAMVKDTQDLRTLTTGTMSKAIEPFASHSADVNAVLGKVKSMLDRAAQVPKNKEIAMSWEQLNNEILTPYFNKWQTEGMLNAIFINESIRIAESSFDKILAAEEAKPRK